MIYIEEEEEKLKEEKIDLDSTLNYYNKIFEKIIGLKNKIEKEINNINNYYDKVMNEIKETYEKKHEALIIEENNLKDNLQNEVTKTKEKLENFLSESDNLIRISERINKGIKIYQKDDNKFIAKTLSYISYINKNKKEIEMFMGKLMKNIKINFNQDKCNINYEEYNFNGINLPKVIECQDINWKTLKAVWKLDDIKIENIDINKINFRVEIKKENTNELFTKVYEGPEKNCLIENLNKDTNYEVRICSLYDSFYSDYFEIKTRTDFFSESIILNREDKNILLNWLNPLYQRKKIYLKLIYRRGNDLSYETFHSKCDNKGPTLTVVKSNNEKFGGYTNINWESKNKGRQIYASKSFIFSINKNKKYEYSNKTYNSIYLYVNHGPDFFCDFAFNSSNKKMGVCFCATKAYGYAYSIEPLVGDGSAKEINVDEIEVFKVKSY